MNHFPSMYTIGTSVCVDTDPADQKIFYPMTGGLESEARRETYWKLATLLCCSSLRCNPEKRHVIFTNDRQSIRFDRVDIRKFLEEQKVEITFLPFSIFSPPREISFTFRNNYYKLDVCRHIGMQREGHAVLLDSDCLWIRPDPAWDEEVLKGELLLLDVYKRTDPFSTEMHGMSMQGMGELYKKIEPSYPTSYPIWYGGEIIGSTTKGFSLLSEELTKLHHFLVDAVEGNQSYTFANGWTMFDGDELYCNFVYNKKLFSITEVGKYVKRIWSIPDLNNVEPHDLERTIWHLPGEKNTGLMLLFEQALRRQSEFWKVPLSEFAKYLGTYVGVPERRYMIEAKRRPLRVRVAQLLKSLKL